MFHKSLTVPAVDHRLVRSRTLIIKAGTLQLLKYPITEALTSEVEVEKKQYGGRKIIRVQRGEKTLDAVTNFIRFIKDTENVAMTR